MVTIMRLRANVCKIILLWISFIFHQSSVNGGKTATKVGLAGVATAGGGGSGGYQVTEQSLRTTTDIDGENRTTLFKNEVDRLKYDLLIAGQYDRSLRPVLDPKSILSINLDFTMRQIMDLDEKNQILKTYLWMKQYWRDEFLAWNETNYSGIDKIWLPSSSVWKPDIVVYEDTGLRDYSPRLPYYRVTSDGQVSASEPIVVETSCSIDILFFPFDYQRCSFTFTSWTLSSDKLDVIASRDSHSMMDNIKQYFLKTGEWTIQDILIVKTSESFASLQAVGDFEEEEHPEDLHPTDVHHDEEGDHHGEEKEEYHEGEDIPAIDTERIRKIPLDITKTVAEVYPDRVTSVHWSDIKYTFILRRNSSLYMQSMLFPAILLTTVALLGFYLPPDSGERIGLQITILLTFMVFLLTVGEMFPASTGPFLGVYYVLCMALLGVNLFMTVLVLHLHYMPSAAVIGVTKNGNIYIKTVPRWVRILLRIAKFRFRDTPEDGRTSPTTQIVLKILKTGHLSTEVPAQSPKSSQVSFENKNGGFPNGGFVVETDNDAKEEKMSEMENGQNYIINTGKSAYPVKFSKKRVSPTISQKEHTRKELVDELHHRNKVKSGDETISSESGSNSSESFCVTLSDDQSGRSKVTRRRKKSAIEARRKEKFQQKIQKSMDNLKRYLKAQNENLKESNMSAEIENEWKAMARTIDHLCMQTYVLILVLSHIIILATAVARSFNYDHDDHAH